MRKRIINELYNEWIKKEVDNAITNLKEIANHNIPLLKWKLQRALHLRKIQTKKKQIIKVACCLTRAG